MKRILLFALGALFLASCEQAPGTVAPAPLAFESLGPINFNVAKIDYVDQYQSPMHRPNIEQEMPVAPARAVRQWANQRLRAVGSSGTLQVTLHEASIIETPLKKKTDGLKGLLTDDQDTRDDGKIALSFRVMDATSPAARAVGDVEVTRFITHNEKATVNTRSARRHTMLDSMMNDVDREANQRFQQYFRQYLK